MELRPGYKQSDVGVIPTDWSVRTLESCAETSSGTTPARSASARYYVGGTIPWVKTLDLTNSVITKTDECITEAALRETSLRLYPAGTILVAMYGGFAQIGRTGLLSFSATVNQALTAIHPDSKKLDSKYLLYVLNYRIDYWKTVASSSRKDPNITGNDVRSFLLAVPPTEEQRAIAVTFSDVDALITGLEELIAKKRDLKQAAMQQLLTGRKRLAGFSRKWEAKKLEEICEISMGRTPSRLNPALWGGHHVWLSIADLTGKVVSESKEKITNAATASMTAIPKGTLLMSFKLSIGRLCFAGCDLYTNEAICAFNNLQAEAEYLYYALSRTDFSLYGKQAVKGYTLNKQSLASIKVKLPERDEQRAIAAALSDLDVELTALEARLTKTRALKQGMMQELLTGRTRLM